MNKASKLLNLLKEEKECMTCWGKGMPHGCTQCGKVAEPVHVES